MMAEHSGGYVTENAVYCRPCGEALALPMSDFWTMAMMRADFEDEFGQDCDRCHICLVKPDPEWAS